MNPDFMIALMQVEHRARIAPAERFGHHQAVSRKRRARVRRAWQQPRFGRRPRVVVAPA